MADNSNDHEPDEQFTDFAHHHHHKNNRVESPQRHHHKHRSHQEHNQHHHHRHQKQQQHQQHSGHDAQEHPQHPPRRTILIAMDGSGHSFYAFDSRKRTYESKGVLAADVFPFVNTTSTMPLYSAQDSILQMIRFSVEMIAPMLVPPFKSTIADMVVSGDDCADACQHLKSTIADMVVSGDDCADACLPLKSTIADMVVSGDDCTDACSIL
ncbi:hypothetical protein PoB_005534800 [Plakobranchus ocellatus]|uniref:Uncharacterized protein n=1 Tax=Plakobranchus ocellatus TaxID=259542 RepID=A0AAV4CCY0_9GAST|nr:hypothetical protein PoB_005534800 [Plakobranchus ocellatus]